MTSIAILDLLLAEPALPGWLIQALLVFFFIVLPIIRSIRESLAKKKEFEQRRSGASPDAPPEPDIAAEVEEARRRWRELVSGEAPAAPVAQAAPPPPIPRPTMAEAAPPAQLAGQLSDFRPTPTEDEVEAANDEATADAEHFIPDEETRAREENERRLREEREARSEFLRRERESGAGRRAGVASDPMTSLGAPTAAAEIQRKRRPDVLFGETADPAARRAALRRAIVAAEVLGTPAALRDPATGPVGLRRSA